MISFIAQWAKQRGDQAALITREQPHAAITWAELHAQVHSLVQEIAAQGFRPGDRLVHSFGNTRLGVGVALASWMAGTVEVPLDPLASAADQLHKCQLVAGRWFAEPASTPRKADRHGVSGAVPVPARDPALILFTSGSTGEPRGVVLSRHNLWTNARAKLTAVPQTPDDVRLTLLPLWHAYARTCDLLTWVLSGCTLVIAQGWDGWQQMSGQVRPTLVNVVPSLAERIAAQELGTSNTGRLRLLGCGGAALRRETFERYREANVTVIQGYGLTEASPVVCSATPADALPGFVGKPVPGCHTRIAIDGRLEVAGDGVMVGYWNDPQATREKIRDGWLDTGDCVEVDPSSGQYRILGRFDDRITLSNGHKLFPGPIERLALGIPGVKHALLLEMGRHVDLFLELEAFVDADRCQRHVELAMEPLPAWQRPQRIMSIHGSFADRGDCLTAKGTLRRHVAAQFCRQQVAANQTRS